MDFYTEKDIEVERLRVENQEWQDRCLKAQTERDSARHLHEVAEARAAKAEAEVEQKARDWSGVYAHDMAEAVEQRDKAEAEVKRLRAALGDMTFDEWGAPTCWPNQERVMALLAPEVKP
jgi:chromosome segregation ATPase